MWKVRDDMKYISQFSIILGISFLGEVLHALLPLPVPASIYGIVILFLLLETKVLALEKVKETGKFLVAIMPVMFIPAAVGLIDSWEIIKPAWISYVAVTAVSTALVMGVTGKMAELVLKGGKKRK